MAKKKSPEVDANSSLQSDELLTIASISRLHGIPVGTLRFLRHHGGGPPGLQLGPRMIVFHRDDVDKWVKEWRAAKAQGGAS